MALEEAPAVRRDGEWVKTQLEPVTERARRDLKCRITSLAHLLSEGFLVECFRELKRNEAPGIDGVTVKQYEERLAENIKDLVGRLKGKQYVPQPVKRVYIPKDEKSLRPLGFAHLTRYADDFIVCFQREDEAKAFEGELRERFARFGPKISETKSRTIEFGRKAGAERKKAGTFDFLGFTHYCGKTRNGKFKVAKKTSKKKLSHACGVVRAMNHAPRVAEAHPKRRGDEGMVEDTVSETHRTLPLLWSEREPGRALKQYYWTTLRLAFKWANRRSQKKSYTWQKFRRVLAWNPLPQSKIYHWSYHPSST